VRLLFSMRHLGSLRMYESVLRSLAAAGNEIDIAARRRDVPGTATAPEAILADVPQIRWIWEDVHVNVWSELAASLRIWLDYLRYCEPRYANTPRLRIRVAERVPALLVRIANWPVFRTGAGLRLLTASLRVVERALPRQENLDRLMRDCRPDVVLLTPLLRLGSSQVEVLRSARAYGARTGLCVASWDHLSSKARIAELPDRVFVWNETQKEEAVTLHGVPPDRVAVTGAQCYDEWFARVPVRTREEFCRTVKLPADRPMILYACSAFSPATPIEARFVRRWIEGIRASDDPLLRTAGILVRPHPQRHDEWNEVDLSDLPDVTLFGEHPLDERAKEDYFESLHYSTVVVGLLTSAFLEASVLGRPVHVFVPPEFEDRQEGLIHFHYLQTVGGGLFHPMRDFDEHCRRLADSLRDTPRRDLNAAFVKAFIRPHGIDRAATETFVAAVETFAASPAPAPAVEPLWAPLVRLAVFPIALMAHRAVGRATNPADRTVVELQQARRRDQHRRDREAEEQRKQADKEAGRRERVRRAEAARHAELRAREERIDADQRQKREHLAAKQGEKRKRERAKRRAAIFSQIKRRLGVS
jgi:CDP-glycerol glycerophosphotransferase (TagB/SpsB family)